MSLFSVCVCIYICHFYLPTLMLCYHYDLKFNIDLLIFHGFASNFPIIKKIGIFYSWQKKNNI